MWVGWWVNIDRNITDIRKLKRYEPYTLYVTHNKRNILGNIHYSRNI